MNFSKVIMLGMMLVTFSMFVYVSAITIDRSNIITGFANTPVCPIGEDCSGGVAYCGDGICNAVETCQTCLRDCPESATCTVNLSQFDEPSGDGGDLQGIEIPCSDGTPANTCSDDNPGFKCNGRGQLIEACSLCRCGAGNACDVESQECLPAHSCEDAGSFCLAGPECPGNTTALPQFNRHCNLVAIGLPKPNTIPRVCCWPNQAYLDGLGGSYINNTNQTSQDIYEKLRQELGICVDQSSRDSCSTEGFYCNNELQLIQDCTKCGCGQGFLCYEKKCVSPEEYDRLAFFNEVLQLSPIERILVEKPQQEVFDISNTYSPGEYAQSFSPLYSGAQDIVPSLSKSTSSDKRTVLLSGIVPQRDNDRFEVAISVVNNRPKIDFKFGS